MRLTRHKNFEGENHLKRFDSIILAVGLFGLWPSLTLAQTTPPIDPVPTVEPTSPSAVPIAKVPSGTQIIIEIMQLVSTKIHKPDDTFDIRLIQDVKFKDITVIPAGTVGKGLVIDSGKPGMGGKPAKLVLAVRYLQYQDKQIPIRGMKLQLSAQDNAGTAVLLSSIGGPIGGIAGLIVTGGHMEVPAGTLAQAKLSQDYIVPSDLLPKIDSTPPAPQMPTTSPATKP